jgi:abortive infection bacteriophage resistance protein
MNVLLTLEYLEMPEEFQTGVRHQMSFGLTTQQALALAPALEKWAKRCNQQSRTVVTAFMRLMQNVAEHRSLLFFPSERQK